MPKESTADALTTILDTMQTAVICCTATLDICYANAATEALFYTSKKKLIGTSLLDYLADDKETVRQISLRTLEGLQTFMRRDIELRLKYKTTLVDYVVTPLAHGNCALLVEVHEKSQQARIIRDEKINQQHAISRQLIRGVAHEIKNPLAGIRGAAQLLMRAGSKSGLNSELGEYTEVIIQESDRLKNLANSMLGSHKLPNLTCLSVHEPLEHVVKLLTPQHPSLNIERDYDLSLPEIYADKSKLIQVFLNIASNAAQAMSEARTNKPTLTLKTRVVHGLTINQIHHRNIICINITDNGPGIPDALKDTLFYPMVTGRAKGTGLGLSIAQDIIQQHGGMIKFTSQTNTQKTRSFTEFGIYLPIKTDLMDAAQAAQNTRK